MIGVLFGLACALLWGSGDFVGGVATRRNHALQVLVAASLSGMLLLAFFAIIWREGLPTSQNTAWAAAAGISGGVAIAALYRGLATGYAAEVAPLAAVIGAAIPVATGASIQGWPPIAQMMGFITALPGVWLVSRPPATAGAWSSEDFGFACLAGIGIGGFLVFMAQVGTGPVFTPLLVARTASLCAGLSLVWMLGLRSVRLHRPLVACLAGCLDAGGNVLYLLATRYGRLDVAAVLSSMYPLTTVTLAYWLQAQSVTRMQSLGVGLCLVAVALMAA